MNFLVCMSSYRRPMECMSQIQKFMNMNFENMLMSVIVRGVDFQTYNNQIIPTIQKYIDENRLVISLQSNSNNFIKNITDCIKQCPEYNYDYFFKIDDDDWYSLNYLNEVQNHFIKYPRSSGTNVDYRYITTTGISDDGSIKTVLINPGSLCGGTLVCNNRLSNIYIELGDNLSQIPYLIKEKYNINIDIDSFYLRGYKEDKLLHRLIEFGKLDTETYIPIKTYNLYSIYRIYNGVIERSRI